MSMTVLEATNKLIEYFTSNDYFEMSKDFTKVVLISDTLADQAAILIALEELEKQQFLMKKTVEQQEFWILVKPLALHMQDIQISLVTAIQISKTINKFIDKEEDKIHPMRLCEQDIFNLTILANK